MSQISEIKKQFIINEEGSPTAVIIPIKEYKEMLVKLEQIEDQKEAKVLSQSPEFKKLIKKSIEDIELSRTKYWKEIWNEL